MTTGAVPGLSSEGPKSRPRIGRTPIIERKLAETASPLTVSDFHRYEDFSELTFAGANN